MFIVFMQIAMFSAVSGSLNSWKAPESSHLPENKIWFPAPWHGRPPGRESFVSALASQTQRLYEAPRDLLNSAPPYSANITRPTGFSN